MRDQSFDVTAGDSGTLSVVTLQPDGFSPFPLLAFDSLVWVAKRTPNAPDAEAVMSKGVGSGITVTDGAGGLAEIAIDNDDWDGIMDGPSRLYWRLRITTGDDTVTLAKGTLEVELT